MSRKIPGYLSQTALGGLMVLVVAACATSTAGQESTGDISASKQLSNTYADVHAVVNETYLTVQLPLDQAVTQDFDTQMLYFKSQISRIEQCIKADGGSSAPTAAIVWDQIRPEENLTYGRWDTTSAKEFGLDIDPRRGMPRLESIPVRSEDLSRFSSCYQKLVATPSEIDTQYRTSNAADRLRDEAITAVRASEEGRSILSDLSKCLSSRGLEADSQGQLAGQYAAKSKADRVVTGTILAECNKDLRVPHQLFDLQAKYEQASIDTHESDLDKARKEKQAFVHRLEASINGG